MGCFKDFLKMGCARKFGVFCLGFSGYRVEEWFSLVLSGEGSWIDFLYLGV